MDFNTLKLLPYEVLKTAPVFLETATYFSPRVTEQPSCVESSTDGRHARDRPRQVLAVFCLALSTLSYGFFEDEGQKCVFWNTGSATLHGDLDDFALN